jgi:cell division septal protein FtsQ
MAAPPGSTPLHQKTRIPLRKSHYYSLNSTGAEVRLPALPQLALGWRLLSGSLVLGLVAILVVLWSSPTFQVSQLKLVGAKRLSVHDLNSVLDLAGLPVVELAPAELEEQVLRSFPEIESLDIQVGMPARVILSVKERTPLLAWQREDTVMWIDQAGVAFPPRGEAGVDLIYVQAEGDPPGIVVPEADPKEGEAKAAATTATAQAPQNQKRNPVPGEPYITTALVEAIQGLNEIRPSGAPVAYHPRYGLGWNDPQGWKVYFGQEVIDMEEKLNAYQAIVAQVVEKGVHPTLISVEFLHAPFYRLE